LVTTVAKFHESAPWLMLGLVTTVFLQNVKLPNFVVKKLLTFSTLKPSFYDLLVLCFMGSVLGILTPLCSCGAIPMAIGFASTGASPAAVVSFLTAAQSAGLDSAAITYGLLGGETASIRLAGAVILSVAAGVAVGRIEKPVTNAGDSNKKVSGDENNSSLTLGMGSFKKIYILFNETWIMLSVGIFISVFVQDRYSASDLVVKDTTTYQDLLTRLTVVLGSLPFQLCEHGVVAFASALQKSGVSHGTAHAFLLIAPATNIATLGAILKTTGGLDRLAPLRSAIAITFAGVTISYILDEVITSESGKTIGRAVETFSLPEWWVNGSAWVCDAFVFISLLSMVFSGFSNTLSPTSKIKQN
jgi:uncharacterized protein